MQKTVLVDKTKTQLLVDRNLPLIPEHENPPFYCRFLDDSVAYCLDQRSLMDYKSKLCCFRPSLKFTHEVESNMSLSFLDVLVERTVGGGFVTSVYSKPTFTSMYLQWDSYCPVKYKVGLVRCLVNTGLRICSDGKLNDELQFLKELFLRNGYLTGIVNKFVSRSGLMDVGKVNTGQRVFFRLPYVGERHCDLERRVRFMWPSAPKFTYQTTCSSSFVVSEARGSRPRRGRPPRASVPVTKPALTRDNECDAMVKIGMRRSVRLQNEKMSDGTVNGRDNVDSLKTISIFE